MSWKNVQYQNGKMRTSEGGGGGSSGHDYSTTEQVIGTWIDGKPLYEKVISFQSQLNISYNSWQSSGETINNCKYIIKATAITLFSGNISVCTEIMARNNNGSLELQTMRNGDTSQCDYLIIQYTKTTD